MFMYRFAPFTTRKQNIIVKYSMKTTKYSNRQGKLSNLGACKQPSINMCMLGG